MPDSETFDTAIPNMPPPPEVTKPQDRSDIAGATVGHDPRPPLEGAIVTVRDLTKRYRNVTAVDAVDLDVPSGSIFGLIGPNGAGKSTTFSILASLLSPSSGSVSVCGLDPGVDTYEVRRRIGYMPDQLGLYGALNATEYLEFFAASYKLERPQWPALIDGLLELVGMGGKAHVDVDSMSRGMKQRMSLARALVHDPELLILDEPASGLDPRARVELRELLQSLSEMGKTIIISSHILAELQELCTDLAIIEGGRLIASGTPSDIADQLGKRQVAVRFLDGTSEVFSVTDDHEQAQLLKRLIVDDGRAVLSCNAHGGGLEDLFMDLTRGGVQ